MKRLGCFRVYTALGQEQEPKAIACIREVLTEFLQNGPTQEELELAREQEQGQRTHGAGGHLRPDEPSGPLPAPGGEIPHP